jgi:hypothetical protein
VKRAINLQGVAPPHESVCSGCPACEPNVSENEHHLDGQPCGCIACRQGRAYAPNSNFFITVDEARRRLDIPHIYGENDDDYGYYTSGSGAAIRAGREALLRQHEPPETYEPAAWIEAEGTAYGVLRASDGGVAARTDTYERALQLAFDMNRPNTGQRVPANTNTHSASCVCYDCIHADRGGAVDLPAMRRTQRIMNNMRTAADAVAQRLRGVVRPRLDLAALEAEVARNDEVSASAMRVIDRLRAQLEEARDAQSVDAIREAITQVQHALEASRGPHPDPIPPELAPPPPGVSNALVRRLQAARASQARHPGSGACLRCGMSWAECTHHITYFAVAGRHTGMFPLCEDCWQELGTPASRLPYYDQLRHEWIRQGAADSEAPAEIVREAVLNGG